MRPLILCQSCKRHVKASEAQCPFCSAAVVLERAQGLSARGRPGGRAALFLAGTALTAGCADEPEPDAMGDPSRAGSDAGTQRGPSDAGAVVDAGRDAGMLIAQPYGIPPDRWRDASIVTPQDAGPTCPQVGNLPTPVYGVAVDSGSTADLCRDAGADAGKDAGADAGKDAGTDAGKDGGLIVAPAYGIAIDSGGGTVPPYGVAIDW
jgi:hypothetical protein